MTTTVAAPPAPPAPTRTKPKPPATAMVWRTVRYVLLIAFVVVMLMPLYVLIVTSFKSGSEIGVNGQWSLPAEWTLASWEKAWDRLSGSFFRTFQLAVPVALISAFIGAMNGFVLSRWRFPGADVVFTLILFGMFIPYQAILIPLVQFLRSLPGDMEEAARVDGANSLQTLVFIVVPMLAPALISVCLFQFMWTMNDFLGPLIYLSSVDKYPVSLALKLSIDTTEAFEWNRILAMSVLTILPALVIFFAAQRYFIEGISAGGVKG